LKGVQYGRKGGRLNRYNYMFGKGWNPEDVESWEGDSTGRNVGTLERTKSVRTSTRRVRHAFLNWGDEGDALRKTWGAQKCDP